MDFFESQDIARRNTRLLLFLFTLAVLSLVVLSNLLVFGPGAYRFRDFLKVGLPLDLLLATVAILFVL